MCGQGENFEMIRDILHEVAALFPSHYLHLGGDEVSTRYWQKCPRCQELMKAQGMKSANELFEYFVDRVEKIAHEEGNVVSFGTKPYRQTSPHIPWYQDGNDLATCKKRSLKSSPSL